MTIQVALRHRTSYRFVRPVTLGPHLVRLRPAPHSRTRILAYSLEVEPKAHQLHWQQDPFGNWQARVSFLDPADRLTVAIDLLAEMAVVDPFAFYVEPEASQWPFAYDPSLEVDLRPYLETEPVGPAFQALLDSIPRDPSYTVTFLVELNQLLAERIDYQVRLEPGVQTLEETLERNLGSCRDTGWLLMQLCRQLGIAARFVSGYLIQLAGDPDGSDGPAADIPDLHAWAEVFLPGAGWIGLDPTSGLLTGEGHIPLAATPRPDHAAPITGTAELPASDFGHEMTVERLVQRPRPMRPFVPSQWAAVDALGRTVDDRVNAAGLALRAGRQGIGRGSALPADWPEDIGAIEAAFTSSGTLTYRLDGMPASSAPDPVIVEAPFAHRADLLGSVVRYWQQHPALSYIFSGSRVGPQGPAPRVDELGADRLGELSLALDAGGGLSDLLTDAAGNRGGAELAFEPALDRLALRPFGAPPQPRMAALEHLLVRALILRLWQAPCRTALVAHGPALADHFMLPYWLRRDLEAVLDELRGFGLAFDSAWFEAQLGLRMPLYGSVEVAGVRLELRAALEPVRLLPVETADGERLRLVDDSLDRLEVRVIGEIADRHVVTCNGWALPLCPTPEGFGVAGVRFRARSLPRLWQPKVAVTTPLCFDLVDTVLGRSLGGCRYHVSKADGSIYDAAPVNDLAAEPRRLARFEPMGHTVGMIQPRRSSSMLHLPHTLDLRHVTG